MTQIKLWKENGFNVILPDNFNQDVYTDQLAKRLTEPDLGMVEQVQKTSDTKIPQTHRRGVRPICGIFAIVGVKCVVGVVIENTCWGGRS